MHYLQHWSFNFNKVGFIESYMAYGDWMSIADLTRSLVQNAAMAVAGSHVVTHHDGRQADLGGQWKQISLYDAISNGVHEQVEMYRQGSPLQMLVQLTHDVQHVRRSLQQAFR